MHKPLEKKNLGMPFVERNLKLHSEENLDKNAKKGANQLQLPVASSRQQNSNN